MKAIMIVRLDDSFMPLDEDTITLEKGTIKYRDINRNPFAITIEGLKLKPLPERMKADYDTIATCEVTEKVVAVGWNACIETILGEEENG